MTFSIIIPCYNSAFTIEATLDSIVSQKYKDWEVLIVDDKSIDNTVEIINSYKAKHNECNIQLYQKKINSGPGQSRNMALEIARGDYFIFIDSDDGLLPDTLEIIYKKIVEENADIVCYGCRLEIGSKFHFRYPRMYKDRRENVALCGGSLCSFAASRKLWRGVKMPSIKNAEDIAIIPVLYMRAHNISVVEKCLYRYIYRANSLSSKKNKGISDDFCKSFLYTLQYPECREFPDEIEFHGIKTILYGAVLNALLSGVAIEHIKGYIYDFEQLYPLWYQNEYIKSYPGRKRFFLRMVKRKRFLILRLYVLLQELYLKILS